MAVLSYHPCFVADQNRICAGRAPDDADDAAMAAADAVILPQGCSRALYRMARRRCPRVFPNYDARFAYPGKTGQIRLFRKTGTPHPETRLYPDVDRFLASLEKETPMKLPFVFKFDWGGEGDGVYPVADLDALRRRLAVCRTLPPPPCLIQQHVDHGGRTLRVVVVGSAVRAYWKVLTDRDRFCASTSRGAAIDPTSAPARRTAGIRAVKRLCAGTGIDLAGFDLIFPEASDRRDPLFLEINYFFGRKGLGGANRYYRLLEAEIRAWLDAGHAAGAAADGQIQA